MKTSAKTPRRDFLTGVFATTAAAVSLPLAACAEAAPLQMANADWVDEVPGTNRCFFDFPQHKNGFPLLHILNYINTYNNAFGTTAGEVGAVGSFYSAGGGSSIPMGFDDEMWAKYELGAYMGLSDANGQPYTRNVFNSPTEADGHLFAQAMGSAVLAPFGGAIVGSGIANLQSMGTKFIMCNNALNLWTVLLESEGKGAQPEINEDLRAHLLPDVTIVPAMVIAIQQAQSAGIAYNKQ